MSDVKNPAGENVPLNPPERPPGPPPGPYPGTAFEQRYGVHYAPNYPVHHRKPGLSNVFLYILAVFLPPVPVFLKAGCGAQVLINVLLWMLCWIPGVLHACYIVAKYP